ncbi:chloride channel protein [Kordia sp. YSTF-M3]|uniref:Chloride channel protein n=1 Tax=Kordia aestuariivivens TaxID=2759037 RepID=A0ABR7Q6R9_9FLAO|nr:chloride channel protein [Kordia aestuariivivens]MBC8754262.1 chloride channel protein [Kordia aestuariivivens]
MPTQKKSRFTRFLIWRYKHISNKNFIFILSILVGLSSGLVAVTIKNITFYIQALLENVIIFSKNQLYFILPVVGLLLVYLLVKFVFKKQPEHAISSILYALSKRTGIIANHKMYLPLITAPLTVGFGGSVGLLGPAVASGSAISANISKLFHINSKTRMLLIGCAAAGAISSIFKSPIAAIIFAIEVFSLDLTLTSLIPLLLASVSAVVTSYFFLGNENLFNFKLIEQFQLSDIPFYIALGIGTAFASIYFTKMHFAITKVFERFKRKLHKLIFGGLAIGVMLYFIPPLYGEGLGFVTSLLDGNHIEALGKTPVDNYTENIWVVIILLIGITIFKAIAMTTTFAAGGSGGIFIPTMVMGSALGNVVAKVINQFGFNVSEANFTLVGMAGLIAGVIHAPLTAIFLIAEITGGYDLFIPLMLTCAISFLITKNVLNYTIYTRELSETGELLTHNKDETVLTLMALDSVIEQNFTKIQPEMTLGTMLHEAVAKSSRNLFPVVDEEENLVGIIVLDDIREFMFDTSLYDSLYVDDIMHNAPDYIIYEKDNMKSVMKKFQDSSAWNLPVLKDEKYYGFVSKSKLLTAYRRKLINFTR